jgi:hypothetical protein
MFNRACRVMTLAIVLSISALSGAAEPPAAPPVAAGVVDLDKNYRLQFTLASPENSQSYAVLASQSNFAVHYGASKDGAGYTFDLQGTVTVRNDGKGIRVSFKTSLERTDEAGDGFDLSTTGSAIVALGKPKSVAKFGEYELKLTVTEDDEKPADAPAKEG